MPHRMIAGARLAMPSPISFDEFETGYHPLRSMLLNVRSPPSDADSWTDAIIHAKSETQLLVRNRTSARDGMPEAELRSTSLWARQHSHFPNRLESSRMEYRKLPCFSIASSEAGVESQGVLFTSAPTPRASNADKALGANLEPHPNLAELSGLLENDDAESTLGERKRKGQALQSAPAMRIGRMLPRHRHHCASPELWK